MDILVAQACRRGDVNALSAVIERGEDVNEGHEDNYTSLMHASRLSSEGHLECMRILINYGANNVNARNDNQSTALHFAAESYNIDAINLLLDNGAELDPVNNNNDTPLMLTCYDNFTIITRILIERGANLTIPDYHGNTCLHYAIENLNIDMIKLLFEYGADDAIVNVFKTFYFFCYIIII